MKRFKKLLVLLLSFIFVFGLALPVLAQESILEHSEATENPAMPVITVQPQGGRVRVYEAIRLSVQASIPNGESVSYRWYRENNDIEYFDTATLLYTEAKPGDFYFYVEVYNRNHPEYSVISEIVRIEVYETFIDRFTEFRAGVQNSIIEFLRIPEIIERIIEPLEIILERIFPSLIFSLWFGQYILAILLLPFYPFMLLFYSLFNLF